jgi:hypothetical protein
MGMRATASFYGYKNSLRALQRLHDLLNQLVYKNVTEFEYSRAARRSNRKFASNPAHCVFPLTCEQASDIFVELSDSRRSESEVLPVEGRRVGAWFQIGKKQCVAARRPDSINFSSSPALGVSLAGAAKRKQRGEISRPKWQIAQTDKASHIGALPTGEPMPLFFNGLLPVRRWCVMAVYSTLQWV